MSAMTSSADTATKPEQAKAAVSTASDKAGEVAAEAGQQVRNVVEEAKQQSRELVDRTREDVLGQARERGQQAAGSMRTLADRLGALADGNATAAGPLVEYVREGQYRINRLAGRLDEDPEALFEELRHFARRKPAVFLAGAGVLGFLAGRLVRSGNQSSSGSTARSALSVSPPLASPPPMSAPVASGAVTAPARDVPGGAPA
jgi:ElaB/YqjD/DUF883 family membrane-anchored ribosome-binding protein